jgi:hypothetical protein
MGLGPEYVSAKPAFAGGMLFVATFTPRYIDPVGDDLFCITPGAKGLDGYSRLYTLDVSSGGAKLWGEDKYIIVDSQKR